MYNLYIWTSVWENSGMDCWLLRGCKQLLPCGNSLWINICVVKLNTGWTMFLFSIIAGSHISDLWTVSVTNTPQEWKCVVTPGGAGVLTITIQQDLRENMQRCLIWLLMISIKPNCLNWYVSYQESSCGNHGFVSQHLHFLNSKLLKDNYSSIWITE